MADVGPGLRRLCAVVATETPGLLAAACGSSEFHRLFIAGAAHDRFEVGVAPPGVDEMGLVRDLVANIYREVEEDGALSKPVMLVLHVGIVRVEGDGFGGSGVNRAKALLRSRAVRAAGGLGKVRRAAAGPEAVLLGSGAAGPVSAGAAAAARTVGGPVGRGLRTGDAGADDPSSDTRLAVVMSDGLFTDLRSEGLSPYGWWPVSGTAAWLRSFGSAQDSVFEWP